MLACTRCMPSLFVIFLRETSTPYIRSVDYLATSLLRARTLNIRHNIETYRRPISHILNQTIGPSLLWNAALTSHCSHITFRVRRSRGEMYIGHGRLWTHNMTFNKTQARPNITIIWSRPKTTVEAGKHLLNSGQSQYNIGLWRVSRIGVLFVVDRRCNLATEWTACDSDRTTPMPWRRSPATTTRFLNGIITINYERPPRRFVARCNEAWRGGRDMRASSQLLDTAIQCTSHNSHFLPLHPSDPCRCLTGAIHLHLFTMDARPTVLNERQPAPSSKSLVTQHQSGDFTTVVFKQITER